jgi:tetratricopeptide (TPR) repeat protein
MRQALDAGQPKKAIAALNDELDVKKDDELPKKLEGDNALLVLDRGSIQQALTQFAYSKKDFESADKAIDMLDLSSNATDTIGKYMFSDDSGRYKSPPYEKLLINTMNMVNYLETKDLSGARVEARRLAVMLSYYRDKLKSDTAVLSLAGFLAGYTFEKSGDGNEAMRYYDDALRFGQYSALTESVRAIGPMTTFRSPRLTKLLGDANTPPPQEDEDTGEVVLLVGYGRVPHKVPERLPIGLVMTRFAWAIRPDSAKAANELAAQGLVTWVNFPTLAPERGTYEVPQMYVDGKGRGLDLAVDVSKEVRAAWREIEGSIVASALTRLISRYAVGKGVEAGFGKKNEGAGFLVSLLVQGTLTALDTPDTRSWETLPGRVAVARLRLPVGPHKIRLVARGSSREVSVDVKKGDFNVVSLMALR